MKEFFRIMEKDILKENFDRTEMVVMGIIAPAVFIAVCILASLLP